MYALDILQGSPIISKPDVIALFNEEEGQATLRSRQAHPYFAVHEQAMVEVDDGLPGACTGVG